MADCDRLVEALRAEPTARVAVERTIELFRARYPELDTAGDWRRHLMEILRVAQEQGALELPKSKRLWAPGNPALPHWVKIASATSPASAQSRAVTQAWVPRMRFAARLTRGDQLEAAEAINRWMIQHPVLPRRVPYRERSLEIFGDEKRLHRLKNTDGSLFGGAVHLSDLAAYVPPLPLPYESVGGKCASAAVLFVENHHAYESLVHWNERCRRYRGIVYCAGNALSKVSVCGEAGFESHLDRIMRRVSATRIEYLGDIDPRGVEIPALRDRDRRAAGLRGIEPAAEFYWWLLAHGRRQQMNDSQTRRAVRVIEESCIWLGGELSAAVRKLWSEGMRIAQESLGTHALDEGAPGAI